MDLATYIADSDRKKKLAEKLGSSVQYLYQIATNRRLGSAKFAKRVEEATRELGLGVVPRSSLRPDLFGDTDVKERKTAVGL